MSNENGGREVPVTLVVDYQAAKAVNFEHADFGALLDSLGITHDDLDVNNGVSALGDETYTGCTGVRFRKLPPFISIKESPEAAKGKINLTKTLPTEAGYYYQLDSKDVDGVIVAKVYKSSDGEPFIYGGNHGILYVSEVGGYWAKVDLDQFDVAD